MFIKEENGVRMRLAISGRNGRRVYVPLKDEGFSRIRREEEEQKPKDIVPRITRSARNGGAAVIPASEVLGTVIQRGITIRVGETPVAVHPPKEEHPQTEPKVEVKTDGVKPPEPPKETAVGIGGEVSPEQPDPPKETWRKRRRRKNRARMAEGLEGLL